MSAETYRTGNPALNYGGFGISDRASEGRMSIAGVSLATVVMFAILAGTFILSWQQCTAGYAEGFRPDYGGKHPEEIAIPPKAIGLAVGGALVGFFVALMVIFNPRSAPVLGLIYAGAEGLFLGAFSAGVEAKYPGLIPKAIGVTAVTFGGMLGLYVTGILRGSPGLWKFVLACMLGIVGLYLADSLFRLFGYYNGVSILHDTGWKGLALQGFIVFIAALNLTLDFDQIEEQLQSGQPSYMNWYAGFSLMVTVVWLYVEIIRFLIKIVASSSSSSSDD